MAHDLLYVVAKLKHNSNASGFGAMHNALTAMERAAVLLKVYGIPVVCPHTYWHMSQLGNVSEPLMMRLCLALLSNCKAVLVVDASPDVLSTGMSEEVEFAQSVGIPVFYSVQGLLDSKLFDPIL